MVRALELREESQKREMVENIVEQGSSILGQVLAIGGQALLSYVDYKTGGGQRLGRTFFIPSPMSFGPTRSTSSLPLEFAVQRALKW